MVGPQEMRSVIVEGRVLADRLRGSTKSDMVRLCEEADAMSDKLAGVCREGKGASQEAKAMREQIDAVLQQIRALTSDAVLKQVKTFFY